MLFDDILMSDSCRKEHDDRLRQVLARFEKYGVRVGKKKCVFYQNQVQYLGFVVSKDGVHPDADKVNAIFNAPIPTDVSSLQSFLGLVNFYGRFVQNLSCVLHPLHELLKKNVKWKWTPKCQDAFDEVKRKLSSSPLLVHYDPKLPVVLDVDASPYGIGGCLSHVMPDGSKRPVYFVSRALASAEKAYGQIEKEALAIVYSVRRLHQFLFGRSFILRTDHKPLVQIFGEHSHLPSTVAARLQRWAIVLSRYSYKVEFVKGSDNVVADCLSRLPLPLSEDEELSLIHTVQEFLPDPCEKMPVSSADVAVVTADDDILSKIVSYVRDGWPAVVNDDVKPYFRCRNDLSVECGCLLRGNRVVIPVVFCRLLLKELHACHFGSSRMKAVARSFFWWPNLDADIVSMCESCELCQSFASCPSKDVNTSMDLP